MCSQSESAWPPRVANPAQCLPSASSVSKPLPSPIAPMQRSLHLPTGPQPGWELQTPEAHTDGLPLKSVAERSVSRHAVLNMAQIEFLLPLSLVVSLMNSAPCENSLMTASVAHRKHPCCEAWKPSAILVAKSPKRGAIAVRYDTIIYRQHLQTLPRARTIPSGRSFRDGRALTTSISSKTKTGTRHVDIGITSLVSIVCIIRVIRYSRWPQR